MRVWMSILLCVLMAPAMASSQEVIDRIAVVVDDNIILKSEIEQYAISLALQLGVDPQKQAERMEELRRQTLNELITQKVLLVKAKEDSIEVNDRQIDALLEEQIGRMVRQLGSERRVEEYFGSSLKQIRREFRPEVEERLMVQRLRERKDFEVQITRREVEEFYRTYRDSLPEVKRAVRISHILMSVQPNPNAAEGAREKAEALLARLRKGEDFATLARNHSEDPGSAKNGGDLGTLERGDLVREFEEVAFALEPGEISGAVRTQFGFHIIQLIEKTGEKIHPRHILIRLEESEADEQNTVAQLRDLREQIVSGELTFEEAAKEYSEDKETASKGGDLGWFEFDQFQLKSFKEAVSKLGVGEISAPVKTDFGYHLVRLDERREARKLDLEKDWEQIETWALNLKRQKVFEEWVERLKKDVYIEIKETT